MERPAHARAVGETNVTIHGRPARVFEGGEGTAVVLVHGGWAGAAAHWSPVWTELAASHHVLAPDLPGVGDVSQPGLGSVGAYAAWLREVLDALGVDRACLVGNSFGAAVACRFAFDFPDRCAGLVLVNGFPIPRTPSILVRLGETSLGRRLVRRVEKWVAYTPAALARAFVDPAKIPDEIRRVVRGPAPQVEALAEVLVHGGGTPRPFPVPPFLLWGEDDRLPGTTKRSARKLEASLPGAKLTLVPHAGHMPQVENARAFLDALLPMLPEPTP